MGLGEHRAAQGPHLDLSPRPLSIISCSPESWAAHYLQKSSHGVLGQAGVRPCPHCCPCHRPLPMPVNEARAHSPSGSSLPGVGQQPHFLAEVAEAQWGEGIACIDRCRGWAPRLLRALLLCHLSPWPGLKRRGRGLAGERVWEDFITQCLLVAGVGGGAGAEPAAGGETCLACLGNYISTFHFACQFPLPGDVGS